LIWQIKNNKKTRQDKLKYGLFVSLKFAFWLRDQAENIILNGEVGENKKIGQLWVCLKYTA
jgi:hypothetical protein